MFQIGQKVECIADKSWKAPYGETVPRKGSIYTVREIREFPNGLGIRLREIVNDVRRYREGTFEPYFVARLFRPVTERKTDTGFAILEEIRKRESVPADEPKRALTSHEGQKS